MNPFHCNPLALPDYPRRRSSIQDNSVSPVPGRDRASRRQRCTAWVVLLSTAAVLRAVPATESVPQAAEPYGWRIEAEAHRPRSDHRLTDDASASGGAAVASHTAWQPMVSVPTLPPDLPESFDVWTRRRGGPLCLKTHNPDGSQRELGWTYGAPKRWTWQKVGTFRRDAFVDGFLLIRDGNGANTTELDAVALVTNATLATAAFAPAPVNVALALDWDSVPSHPITARHWALNDYEVVRAREPSAAFDAALRDISPPILRIHHAGLVDAWTDAKTRSWDLAKIRAAFDRLPAYEGVALMVNVSGWPKWLHDGLVLPEELHAPFAALCADLVRLFRDDLHRPVAYWEVLNERDNHYEKAGDLPALWPLLNTVMDAMRAVDPAAKYGGPALTWPKPEWLEGYLKVCGPKTDFLSWHNYASGSRDEPTETLLDEKVDALRNMAKGARECVAKCQPGRRIEAFLTEYNISWNWETRDPRMVNHVGAAFNALVVMGMAEVGVDGAFVWHLKDGIYGLVDGNNQRRPSHLLFCWGQHHLVGDVLTAAASDTHVLQALAVRRADGGRSLLLINRSDAPLLLPSPRTLLAAEDRLLEGRIDADTLMDLRPLQDPDVPLRLPPLSLRLLITRTDAAPSPDAQLPGAKMRVELPIGL